MNSREADQLPEYVPRINIITSDIESARGSNHDRPRLLQPKVKVLVVFQACGLALRKLPQLNPAFTLCCEHQSHQSRENCTQLLPLHTPQHKQETSRAKTFGDI